jgi:hypothetical protein
MAPLKFSNNKTYLPFLHMGKQFSKETSDLDIALMMVQRMMNFKYHCKVIPQLIETKNQILYFTWQVWIFSDKLGKLGCTLEAVKKEMNWF